MRFRPTEEQLEVVALAKSGDDISVDALAGAGKTSTLALAARELSGRGQYVAFNKAIVNDSRGAFPNSVWCNTAHSLAFKAVGKDYQCKLNRPRMTNRDLATWLGARPFEARTQFGKRRLEADQLARLARVAVGQYCSAPSSRIAGTHVPDVPLFDEERVREELHAVVLPLAVRIWNDVLCPDGQLPFGHDHYLKIWQLSRPTINCDYILFDESQDADPVMLSVVGSQEAQVIYCGDRFQAIYEWRGALNALERVRVDSHAWLTQSFRFGPRIAAVANSFLGLLGSEKKLRGAAHVASAVRRLSAPEAILCRTNAGVIQQLVQSIEGRRKPAVVGGVDDLVRFTEACGVLQSGQRTGHPDLAPFKDWDDVKAWVEEDRSEAAVAGTMVELVERYGVKCLLANLAKCVPEARAEVVVSTTHRAKGREWDDVLLAGDFPHRDDMDAEELRLAYVAVTRARHTLDLTEWRKTRPKERG